MAARRKEASTQTPAPERPETPCARCVDPARVRARTTVGWQNLCHKCNDRRLHNEAEEFCKREGLDTLEKQQEYCRTVMRRGIVKSAPVREPGQDEEEFRA